VEQEHGGQRYKQAVPRLEEKERVSAEMESALRRLVSRVALLGIGRQASTDLLLRRITHEMRGEPSVALLESLLGETVDAIARLDDAFDPEIPAVTPHKALGVALDRIDLSPSLSESSQVLRQSLQDERADALIKAQELADLVNRHGRLLNDDLEVLQGVLHSVGSRLEDIRRYIDTEISEQEASANEGQAWDAMVREEMRELGERSRQAMDLSTLRHQVTVRLETIDQHFRAYRESEDARFAAYRDRADQMRLRVEELESQASSLKDSLQREHERASTDPLTGIPNRLAYETHIEAAWRQWQVDGRPLCVAALDIDHFKRINDSLGHAAGDAVLRIVGQALYEQSDERMFVCRYGGEEFVLVLTQTGLDEALRRGEALRLMVEKLAFRAGGKDDAVTLSGGFAAFRRSDTPAKALERADRALYAAKDAGRNRLVTA